MSFRFIDVENNMYLHEEWVPRSEYEAEIYCGSGFEEGGKE